MKNFVGKMMNLGGLIGLILISCFSIVTFIMGLFLGKNVLGDYSDFKENVNAIYYIVPLILWFVNIIFLTFFIVFDLKSLIHNHATKVVTFLSIAYLVYFVLFILVTIYLRIVVQGVSAPGLNLDYLYWVGGTNLFLVLIILIGNILNIKQVQTV